MKFKFKEDKKDINTRKQLFIELKNKYPYKIPIICEKDPESKINEINKTKFLIDRISNASSFFLLIREKVETQEGDAIQLLVNAEHSFNQNASIGEIYDENHDIDGFLYIAYSKVVSCG